VGDFGLLGNKLEWKESSVSRNIEEVWCEGTDLPADLNKY